MTSAAVLILALAYLAVECVLAVRGGSAVLVAPQNVLVDEVLGTDLPVFISITGGFASRRAKMTRLAGPAATHGHEGDVSASDVRA